MPDNTKPKNKSAVEVNAATFIFFSIKRPNVAAPKPKKKIFKQKINYVFCIDTFNIFEISGEKRLNA